MCVSWQQASNWYDSDETTIAEINGQTVYSAQVSPRGIVMQTLDDEYCQVDTSKHYGRNYNSLAAVIDALRNGTYITGNNYCITKLTKFIPWRTQLQESFSDFT